MSASGLGRRFFVLAVAWLSLPLTVCPLSAQQVPAPVKSINENLAAQWQEQGLTPAGRCTDFEFLRRVSLDLLGRIPTLEECLAYEQDARPDKRGRWVERLLNSQEYPEHWAGLWTNWLLQDHVQPAYRTQLRRWLREQLAAGISHKDLTEKLLTATGKSDENPAVHFVLAYLGQELPLRHGDESSGHFALVGSAATGRQPSLEQLRADGQFDAAPITFRSMQVFLGFRLACTQCHCHPFNAAWRQPDFWGLNVFFRQLERKVLPPTAAGPPVLALRDNPDWNVQGIIFYQMSCCSHKGLVKATGPTFPGEGRVRFPANVTRRQDFARRVLAHPNFARAFVNRVWSELFGRGLNVRPEPDDFGEHNEVVHPELLDQLGKDFGASGYDPKQLIRWICASDVYQLKSEFNETNEAPENEPYFSRQLLRPMTFDQMFESVWRTTRLDRVLTPDGKEPLRQRWLEFLRLDPMFTSGNFDYLDQDNSYRLPLSLLLMNDKTIHRAIADRKAGLLDQELLGQPPEKIIETLFLTTLSRRPTGKEKAQLERELRQVPGTGNDLRPVWQDLFWALLNSNEFILKH
jgi:hypothetical protein